MPETAPAPPILDDHALTAWLADPQRQQTSLIRLDLSALDLRAVDLQRSTFFGCVFAPGADDEVRSAGCAVMPDLGPYPFNPYPSSVYSVPELYRGFDPAVPDSWTRSFDHDAYTWFIDPTDGAPRELSVVEMVAARLHDTLIEGAVTRLLDGSGRRTVGVMGGHAVPRDHPSFAEIADIARALTRRGRLIMTGGGPGLMEAANLGAFLAPFPDEALDRALAILQPVTDFGSHQWLATACQVRAELLGDWRADPPSESTSVGIPVWLYGHEAPNMFATHTAKMFYNSLREEGLVTYADGGILYGEGSAGTVQEIFQDTTQNYYRPHGTVPTPIVLHNVAYWTQDLLAADAPGKPVMPLLHKLAVERDFTDALLLTDDRDAILSHLAPEDAPLYGRRVSWRHRA